MIDFENGAIFKLKPDNGKSARHVEDLLIPGETVLGSYTVVRDFVVFTDKRVIACNIQGVTVRFLCSLLKPQGSWIWTVSWRCISRA